ncbi:hypothetical protein Sjap_001045 [Stephania japonica]|uniref:Uncharacterized protein n=1 Tax=Stephania japonica TaxID=461633 RepID=A0AAP0PSZ0_9MAGN
MGVVERRGNRHRKVPSGHQQQPLQANLRGGNIGQLGTEASVLFRIVARKPKDVWAVRLAIGTYLIDAKHFKPLILD